MNRHDYYERRDRIETPRLWLRPMCEDDAEMVVAWRNDPSAAAMFFSSPPTLEEHRRWFASPRRGRADYVIIRRDESRPIGVVNFKDISESNRQAEAGKLLGDHASRGQGMAKEAFAAWLYYGLYDLGIRQTVVRTRQDNEANIHLNRRLGFEVVDRINQRAADGQTCTFLVMHLDVRSLLERPYMRDLLPSIRRGKNARR